MGSARKQKGLESDATDRCMRLDVPMGEDEDLVENSDGASDDENHVGLDDELVENSAGRDSVVSEGGPVPEQSEDTESESDEVAKTLRFNDLCQRAIKFAEDGATSLNAYRAALGALEKALAEVANAKNGVVVDQPIGSHLSNLITPLTVYDNRRTKTRGRPPSTSRLEPGDEKPEKRTRKCKICKEDGHYMRTCPALRGSSGKLTDNGEGNLDSGENSLLLTTAENDSGKKSLAERGSDSASKKLTDRGRRTSNYRGVTRHRWSGKYEVHLWDNSCEREGQTRKGKLVYLGGYDTEEKAARVYDLAALKFWGLDPNLKLNFPISDYEKQLEEVKDMTREEFVTSQRRKSSGFSRGSSIYRGVTRRAHDGKWQARIGPCAGNRDFYYLGTYSSEREAAEAYDVAAIELRGLNAVTNFDISTYCEGGWKELEWFCKLKKLGQGENLKLIQGESPKLTQE